MKDLLKPGRPLWEYLNEDGTLQKYCLTCIHRYSQKEMHWGGWLCSGGSKKHKICCPSHHHDNPKKDPDYLFWEPRVEVNAFLQEEDFNL